MKRKTLLSLLLCLAFVLSACTSPSPEVSPDPSPTDSLPTDSGTTDDPVPGGDAVDFANGNIDFLRLNTGAPDLDADASMAVADLDGAKALMLTAPNGGVLRVGISVDSLLGERIADVANVVFGLAAEFPEGNDYTISGKITSYGGDMDAAWIYMAHRDVNEATGSLTEPFISGANAIEFSVNAPDESSTPAILYIKSITFSDAAGNAIPVNTSAGWAGPESYGAVLDLPTVDVLAEYDFELVDNKPDQFKFPIADRIGEFSIFKITYTSDVDNTPAIIFMSPPNYWYQFQIAQGDKYWWYEEDDEGKAVDNRYYIQISSADFQSDVTNTKYANDSMCAFKGIPCTPPVDENSVPCCAAMDENKSVVLTNWHSSLVFESFTIENALPR
jgi:hypothetical protein